MILQPSSSPKKLRLGPTTGPRSMRTAGERPLKLETKRASALVACTAAPAAPATGAAGSLRRRENKSESATDLRDLGYRARPLRRVSRTCAEATHGATPIGFYSTARMCLEASAFQDRNKTFGSSRDRCSQN